LPTYRLITRNSAAMAAWFVETLQKLHMTSGSLLGSATNDSTGLVQKELPVTQGRFRKRVDRHDDGSNVGAAPAFARHPVSKLGQAFHAWRIVPVVPLRGSVTMNEGFALHRPGSFSSWSRSAHSLSIRSSIRSRSCFG
jgi:hypothetical protein